MSEPARIAITGVGLHSAHGGTEETWAAILHNSSALRSDHAWNLPPAEGQAAFPAAPAADPSPTEFLGDRKMVKYMGPCTQMAVLAAGRSLRHAGLLGDDAAPAREGMALFLATGPIAFDVEQALTSFGDQAATDLLALRYEGLGRCHPLMPFKMLLNMPLGLVSITFGIKGQNFILYPGADQGALAMAHAVRGLRRGRFVRALVGGSACTLGLSPLMHLRRAQRLAASVDEAQPFSARHAGWAPADQAACLVLETEAEAARRSRPVLAYIDDAAVLGPGSVDHLWQTTRSTQAPDALFCTGSVNAGEVEADRARARLRWAASPTLASGDGVLGVAPAASFVLATALATLALSSRSLPAALCDEAPTRPLTRGWVSFHDQQAAALAVLSGPAEARP